MSKICEEIVITDCALRMAANLVLPLCLVATCFDETPRPHFWEGFFPGGAVFRVHGILFQPPEMIPGVHKMIFLLPEIIPGTPEMVFPLPEMIPGVPEIISGFSEWFQVFTESFSRFLESFQVFSKCFHKGPKWEEMAQARGI